MRLTIDTREPDPHPWQTYLPAGWTATRAALETGDFALTASPERTVIERKTASIAPIVTPTDESAAMEDSVKDFERASYPSRNKSVCGRLQRCSLRG